MDLATSADGSFDIVLDKAAIDALMVDEEDIWYPKQVVVKITYNMRPISLLPNHDAARSPLRVQLAAN